MFRGSVLVFVFYIICWLFKTTIQDDNTLLPTIKECGLDPKNPISEDQSASMNEFLWMALLQYTNADGRGFNCGGALVSNRYVLTAAHCFTEIPKTWKLTSVRLGEYQLDTDQDCVDSSKNCTALHLDVPVEEVIVHKEYTPKSTDRSHNIALVRLNQSISYTENISPICLPSEEHPKIQYGGINMTTSGWGKTENGSRINIKTKSLVSVKSKSECAPTYSKFKVNLMDDQFCAGVLKGQNSCAGDGGGPLMFLNQVDAEYNWYIAGIESFGPHPCNIQEVPRVYTKVVNYRQWILSNMKP